MSGTETARRRVFQRQIGGAETVAPKWPSPCLKCVIVSWMLLFFATCFDSGTFSCNFNIFRYPFDTHVCQIPMHMRNADNTYITFSKDTIKMGNNPEKSLKFAVSDYAIEVVNCTKDGGAKSGFQVRFMYNGEFSLAY